jgi:hypothetical protein
MVAFGSFGAAQLREGGEHPKWLGAEDRQQPRRREAERPDAVQARCDCEERGDRRDDGHDERCGLQRDP